MRQSPRTAGLLVLAALLVAATGSIAASTLGGRGQVAQPASAEPRGLARSAPVQLMIPRIDVVAQVESLALQEGGTLPAPSRPSLVGWYERGTSPGEPGSAVIVGDAGADRPTRAVFDRLDRLVPGDLITVVRADGTRASFTVDQVARGEDPTQYAGGEVQLRLVRRAEKDPEATSDLVVFATLAP